MNILRFREGFKNWRTTYNVEFDFGYDANLRKKINCVVFHLPKAGRKLAVPWKILKCYLYNESECSYADPSGLCIERVVNDLYISDSKFFNLIVQKDQLDAIKIAARRMLENVSVSVENILREFTAQRSMHNDGIQA